MSFDFGNVQTVQQPTQLLLGNGHGFRAGSRQLEVAFFQAFVKKTEAISLPVQNLDLVLAAAVKDI